MATKAADVIEATTRILRSGKESEQYRVQTALAMMGLQQQMKAAEIDTAGKQLVMLESTNIQQMHSQARTFLTVTGFNQWYNPEDEKWAETMVDDLTEAPNVKNGVNVGGYGFSQTDAVRIAGAVQSFYLKNPEGILEIGDISAAAGGCLFKQMSIAVDTATTFFTTPGINSWAGIIEVTWVNTSDNNRCGYDLVRFGHPETFTSMITPDSGTDTIVNSQNATATFSMSGDTDMQITITGAGTYRCVFRIMGSYEG